MRLVVGGRYSGKSEFVKSEYGISEIVQANYNNPDIPEMFLTFSHIKNSLIKELDKNYTDFKVDNIGSWTVITAKRYK